MKQHSIKSYPGSTKAKKRIGRGGMRGNYSGRGMKGQNARTGGGVRPGFEGGQTPLLRRLPKLKGFKNFNRVSYLVVNLADLNTHFDEGAKVDLQSLLEKGLIKKTGLIKLLGTGDLKKKLNVTVDAASESAIKKVEKAEGKVTVLKVKKEATA